MAAVKRALGDPAAHLEIKKGTVQQAIDYCQKDASATDPPERFSFGTPPIEQTGGLKPCMWLDLMTDIKTTNMTADEMKLKNFKLFGMNPRGVSELINLGRRKRQARDITCICIWGETGVGKTHWVYRTFGFENVYVKDKSEWWDGYNGEDVIVMDDFYGEQKLSFMLNLMDRYPVQVQVKGAYVYLNHTKIIFTSNQSPVNWYKAFDSSDQAHYKPNVALAFFRRLPFQNQFHCIERKDLPIWNEIKDVIHTIKEDAPNPPPQLPLDEEGEDLDNLMFPLRFT